MPNTKNTLKENVKGRIRMDELVIAHLTRIENKVDKHTEALERFARTEERVIMLLESFKELGINNAKLEARVDELEKEIARAKTTGNTLRWVFKIGLGTLLFIFGANFPQVTGAIQNWMAKVREANFGG